MVAEDLHILDIAENDHWVVRSADVMQAAIEQAIRLRGRCLLGLSGGSTPAPVFAELANRSIEWENVHLLQVDERVVPEGSSERNLTDQRAAFSATDAAWFPLPANQVLEALPQAGSGSAAPDTSSLADVGEGNPWPLGEAVPSSVIEILSEFDKSLVELAGSPPILDVVHLGLGVDGHTASLLPGDDAVNELLAYSAISAEYQGAQRVTMTRPLMDRARMVIWLVRGSGKREALGRLLQGDMTIPAGLIRPAHSVIIADAEAASQS